METLKRWASAVWRWTLGGAVTWIGNNPEHAARVLIIGGLLLALAVVVRSCG